MLKKSARQSHENLWKKEFSSWFKFFVIVPALLFTVFTASTPAHAASGINKQINFQGKLVDNNGLNVADSTYTVVFSLYTVSSGGAAAWTESDSVTTSNGVFQVALGATTAFPGNVDFNADTWYLGIKVGSDTEMTPRVRFTAVPYAFNAAALDGIVATNSASQFTITGGTNALLDLTVNGSLTLGSIIQPTSNGALTVQSTGTNGLTLDTGGTGAINIGNTHATSIVFGNGTTNPTFSFSGSGTVTVSGGNLAITAGALTLNGTTRISNAGVGTFASSTSVTGSNATYFGINNGTGFYRIYTDLTAQKDFSISDDSGNSKIYLAGNGQAASQIPFDAVGIGPGNTTPHAALDVEGGNYGANAALLVNQTGVSTNDIFTASASGATKFTIQNNGALVMTSASGYTGFVTGASAPNLIYTMPTTGPAVNGYMLVSQTDGTLSWTAAGSCSTCILQSPSSTAANTVTVGNTSGVVGLTVNGTTNVTTADVADFVANVSNSKTATNGILFNNNGGGTTTNGIQIQQSAGTLVNGLTFSGTMTNLISSSAFTVTNAGGVTAAALKLSNFTTQNGLLYFNATDGTVGETTVNSGGIQCLTQTSSGAPTWGACSAWTTFTNNTNTVVVPSPTTDALSIGNAGTGNYLPYSGLYVESPFNSKGNALVAVNQTGTGDIFTASASAAPKFRITSVGQVDVVGGLSADLDTLTTSNGLKIGTVNANALTLGTTSNTTTVQGTFVVGTSGNTFTFSPASGPVYAGSARPTRTITLSPEYAGAVLTAFYGAGTDTNITGNMTSDTDTTQGTSIRNYYNWLASSGTQQFYTVAVRISLPADFAAWATSNAVTVSYITQSATSTNSLVDVRVYNENSASIVASSTSNAATSWSTASFGSSSLTGWATAGQTAVIYLRMGSASSNYARVGDIKLSYVASK